MKTSDIRGIIPPVITPMNNDPEQTVNHEALRQQVERLLAGGVHGMFPLGTNGEAYALSFKEKEEVLATVIDQVKGRAPFNYVPEEGLEAIKKVLAENAAKGLN